jgi:hypothetical protein
MVENKAGPSIRALVTGFAPCFSIVLSELAIVNVPVAGPTVRGRMDIASDFCHGIFGVAFVAVGPQMSSDQGVGGLIVHRRAKMSRLPPVESMTADALGVFVHKLAAVRVLVAAFAAVFSAPGNGIPLSKRWSRGVAFLA